MKTYVITRKELECFSDWINTKQIEHNYEVFLSSVYVEGVGNYVSWDKSASTQTLSQICSILSLLFKIDLQLKEDGEKL